MIDSDEIHRIPPERLRDRDVLSALEAEIKSLTDADDRNHAWFSLTKRLTNEGIFDRAEHFARSIETWPIEKTWLLADIAAGLMRLGHKDDALRLLAEAVSIARANGRDWQRAGAFSRIATRYMDFDERQLASGLLNEAVAVAQLGEATGEGHDIEDSAGVLREVAVKLAQLGEVDLARAAAASIQQRVRRNAAVADVEDEISRARQVG